jgi:hypothetical protein
MSLLEPNQSYTFSKYFELGIEASELAAEFGYSLTRQILNLPQFNGELDRLQELRDRIAELIAIDQWDSSPSISSQPVLVGAISTGTIWQFGTLDRTKKHFKQSINSYRIPEDIEQIMRILVAVLQQNE